MFKTRIAGTAALFTFGLAALGGTALAVAAPGNAETGASSSTSSSSTAGAPTKTTLHSTLSPKDKTMPEPHDIRDDIDRIDRARKAHPDPRDVIDRPRG